jgi:hypothetical protein
MITHTGAACRYRDSWEKISQMVDFFGYLFLRAQPKQSESLVNKNLNKQSRHLRRQSRMLFVYA